MKAKKVRSRLRSWLPWHAFDGLGLDWHAHSDDVRDMSPREVRRNGLILLVVGLTVATCAAALAIPSLSLLIDIIGGFVVATVVLFLTGQWQELRRGLIETGHWPTVDVQRRMIRQYILETLVEVQERRRQRRVSEQGRRGEIHQ